MSALNTKKTRGQFYTVNHSYILEGLPYPSSIENTVGHRDEITPDIRRIMEPFAGTGELLEWIRHNYANHHITIPPIEAYDIDPKKEGILTRDTLMSPPDYTDAWILTNPPYLARNKCATKEIFDKYNTNDLYKCFITSITQQPSPCAGGILIIPAGFFLSPRDIDVRCRHEFMTKYKLLKVKYFEETVFPDTSTTVVAFAFEKASGPGPGGAPGPLVEQQVEWISMPSGNTRVFTMSAVNNWIIGGDIYNLSVPDNIKIRRHVDGSPLKEGEQQTYMTLCALDSGKTGGNLCLEYKEGYIYPAKDCSRSYATLRIQGRVLSAAEQVQICADFNTLIEQKRAETWSLFLPQYRESKEYARKRIPFELAYTIVSHLVMHIYRN